MTFHEAPLRGAFVIESEPHQDDRGFYARVYCRTEFAAHGITTEFVQAGVSFNRRVGTLRGLHYQAAPWAQAKLIRCVQGAIFDVIVDLRPDSETVLQWFACELTAENRRLLYVPEGFAHGFQTLRDATEVCYQFGAAYEPSAERGLRWDDPQFAIDWPACDHRIIAPRDASFPDFDLTASAGSWRAS